MKGSLAHQAGTAVTWKAIQLGGSKGIFLLRTLVLARLLAPEDFGLLAVASAAVGVLMSVTELGMTPALVHQGDVRTDHYDSAWTANVLRASCVSGVLILAAPAIAAVFAEPRAADILRFLALRPLIDASASIGIARLTRSLDYRRLACISLPAVVVDTVVAVSLATTLGVWALVAGTLAGALANLVASYILAPHRPRMRLAGEALRPLIRYGRWVFLSGLVAVLASALTQVVIARRLGAAELGLYFLAGRLAFLPHELASQVVGEVAFPVYARIREERARVTRAFRSVFLGMATFLVPVYVLLIALAPWLVMDLLGERWVGAEALIRVLAISGIAGLFGDATTPLFRGAGRPNWVLVVEVLQSSLIIALIWSLTGRYGALGAAMALVIAVTSSQVVSAVLLRRLLGEAPADVILPGAFVLAASCAGGLTAVGAHQFVSGIGGLLVAVPLACGVTGALLWLLDTRLKLGLWTDLTRVFPRVASLPGTAPLTPR